MSNNVVERVCSRMVQAGMTTLRFNFRGVGGSSGRGSWRGGGEIEDLRTVMAYLREIEGGPKRLILIGYSYGSMISAAVAGMSKSDDSVIASINISYPLGVLWALSFFNTSAMLGRARGCPDMPKLFVIGSSDNFTSSWKLECAVADFPGEQSSTVVHEGLDHFWFGQEDALCDSILEWMAAAI
jgi:alpha/beta superfamily hydrolase